MLSASAHVKTKNSKSRLAVMKRKTKKRVKRKLMVGFFASVATIACLVHTALILSNQFNANNSALNNILSSSPPSRKLLQTEEDTRRVLQMETTSVEEEEWGIDGYPPDLLNPQQRRNGGWVLYFLGMCYTFVAIALVCDEWFVPAIEIIVDVLEMSDDAAGATWMAAGGSAPELFTSLIGTLLAHSNVGFGTIVGSAVFNVLFVIGCCAIFTPGHLPLTWWPFARDCSYYIFSLMVLALFYGVISPNVIQWWEALILLSLYGGYCTIMFKNQQLKAYVFARLNKSSNAADSSSGDQPPANENDGIEMGDTGAGTTAKNRKDSDMDQQTQLVGGARASISTRRDSILPATGVHFHASLYKFLTKDSTIKEHMAVHVVAIIKGEVKETFEAIDTDGNGHIDREELKRVLLSLGEMVSAEDVTNCFNEIDTDGNGQISYDEFEKWYVASELRITTDVRAIFQQFDDNDDGKIESEDLRHLLEAMNDEETEISDDEVKQAMAELGKKEMSEAEISEAEFVAWYVRTPYFAAKQMKRQTTLTAVEEEEENGIDLSMPSGNLGRVMWLITAPIMFTLYYTLPDVQKKDKQGKWPLTFSGSMLWLMFYSYLMVWWAQRVGQAWGVPDEVMGLTFLAAGTSVPDLLSSVIVAKMGRGDMAVSSSIGSNIFDILIGLPFPWLIFCLSFAWNEGKQIDVTSGSLFLSVVILIVMLFCVLIVIKCNGWKLTHKLGYSMFVLWLLFLTQDLIRSLCESCNA